MMNNNTQVSPSNGVDFSRIRKAQQGTKIPKFQTPAGTIPQWYLNLYRNNYRLGNWNSGLNSSYAGATIVGAGNSSLHGKAGDLNAAYLSNAAYTGNSQRVQQDIQAWYNEWVKDHPGATPQQMVDAYNQIAESIRQYQGVEHTYNSKGASTNNRAFRSMFQSRSLKTDPNADMSQDAAFIGYQDSGDDIYGSSSFLRRMDQYEKEYDDLTDEEKAARTHTIKIGDKDIQVYKKANGDISLLPDQPSTPPGTLPGNTPGTPPDTPTDNPDDPWKPVDYPTEPGQQKKFRFPTFPLYNAALLGIANLTNKRIFDIQSQPLNRKFVFTPRYAQLDNGYQERSANEAALNEYKWDVNQRIDNVADLGRADEAYRDIRGKELDTKLANNQIQSQRTAASKANVLETENYNKAGWDQSFNTNNAYHVAEMQRLMNNRAQYEAQKSQNLQENVMANYTDWKAWNRNNQLQDYADWRNGEMAKVQNDLNKAWENYQDSGNLENYQGYKDFWNNLYENGNPRADSKFGTAWAAQLESGVEDTAANRLKFFQENYNNADYAPELGSFATDWQKYQSDAMQNYIKNRQAIESRWGLLDARSKPINFDGEVSSWLYNKMNPRGSYQSIYMKKGGRFLEYLKHNRKAEKDIRDTTMKSMSDSRKMLRRELDALDRESLLLLRAIFK